MITLTSGRHAARHFRHFREQAGRELGSRGIPADVLIDTAHALGFRIALVPQRHPGARDTGTGWPA